jgi:hypothetical protein
MQRRMMLCTHNADEEEGHKDGHTIGKGQFLGLYVQWIKQREDTRAA